MAGELALAHPPDRQRIGRLVGRILLAETAAPDILVERGAQIRTPRQHRVVHGRRAAQFADPAAQRLWNMCKERRYRTAEGREPVLTVAEPPSEVKAA